MGKLTTLTFDAAEAAAQAYAPENAESGPDENLDNIACMAIEFWTVLSDRELALRGTEASHGVVEERIAPLLRLMVTLLCARDEEEDPSEEEKDVMSLPVMASAGLRSLCQHVPEHALRLAVDSASDLVTSGDWRSRDAAAVILGVVMEIATPQGSSPISSGVAPGDVGAPPDVIFNLTMAQATGERVLPGTEGDVPARDESPIVRDSAVWTAALIIRHHAGSLAPEAFDGIVNAQLALLGDVPRVARQAAFALHSLAVAVDRDDGSPNELSGRLYECLEGLWNAYDREDAELFGLRGACFEAVTRIIIGSAREASTAELNAMLGATLDRLVAVGETASRSPEEDAAKDVGMAHCVVILGECVRKLGEDTNPDFMLRGEELVRAVFDANMPISREDAITSLSRIIDASGDNARSLIELWKERIIHILSHPEEAEACKRGIGLISDLALNVMDQLAVIADDVVDLLLAILAESNVSRELKPVAISALGDIAFALGKRFRPYVEPVLQRLRDAQASALGVLAAEDNEDLAEFVEQLVMAVLTAYQTIVGGYNDPDSVDGVGDIVPYVESIVNFARNASERPLRQLEDLQHRVSDADLAQGDPIINECAQLLGDLGLIMPPDALLPHCNVTIPWVDHLLTVADAVESAQWRINGEPHVDPATDKHKKQTDGDWARAVLIKTAEAAPLPRAAGGGFGAARGGGSVPAFGAGRTW
jgi:importin subunit beta-1